MDKINTPPPLSFWAPPSWVLVILFFVFLFIFEMGLPFVCGIASFIALRFLYTQFAKKIPLKKSLYYAVLVLILIIAMGLFLIVSGVMSVMDDQQGLVALVSKINEGLTLAHHHLPDWAKEQIPTSSSALFVSLQGWIESNTGALASAGKDILKMLFHVIIGSFVGASIAFSKISRDILLHLALLDKQRSEQLNILTVNQKSEPAQTEDIISVTPLGQHPSSIHVKIKSSGPIFISHLERHLSLFTGTFEKVVFAQFYIALINAFFTGLFLYFGLPLLGYAIPLVGVLVIVTLLFGMLPIIGNIISNTVIFLVCLSVSPVAAILALSYLIVIHKLEYFLNAWIIGTKTNVRSFELLIAMLVFESMFGLWGLVLAPVLYAYLKEEVKRSG